MEFNLSWVFKSKIIYNLKISATDYIYDIDWDNRIWKLKCAQLNRGSVYHILCIKLSSLIKSLMITSSTYF